MKKRDFLLLLVFLGQVGFWPAAIGEEDASNKRILNRPGSEVGDFEISDLREKERLRRLPRVSLGRDFENQKSTDDHSQVYGQLSDKQSQPETASHSPTRRNESTDQPTKNGKNGPTLDLTAGATNQGDSRAAVSKQFRWGGSVNRRLPTSPRIEDIRR